MKIKKAIREAYTDYGVKIRVHHIATINGIYRYYQIKIISGTRVDDVFKHSKNVQMILHKPTFIPFIEGTDVFLLVSDAEFIPNNFLGLYNSRYFHCSNYNLPIAIGYDLFFRPVVRDLTDMLHIICAGSTGSGKSVFLNCLILSLIMKCSVQEVNLLIFDVGATSLSIFEGIPHLSHPIVKDEQTGIYALNYLVNEMERRIVLDGEKLSKEPAIVCVIDEFVSIISNINDKQLSENYKTALNNILRRGRKAKIHLVLATQNPTADEMKVDIGNAATRVAFKFASPQTSYNFIGDTGATKLPGRGAMLFRDSTSVTSVRVQGGYVSKENIMQLLSYVKDLNQDDSTAFRIPKYNHSENVLNEVIELLPQRTENKDSEFVKIVLWCLTNSTMSALKIRENFSMGNRADHFMERLTKMGIISEKRNNLPRKVLPESLEELSEEARMFFGTNNIEDEAIVEAINKRS